MLVRFNDGAPVQPAARPDGANADGRRRFSRSVRIGAVVSLLLLLLSPHTVGQDVTEVSLKAAFIYNFTKFTDWPAEVLAPSAPLLACVLGDPAMADALARAVKGRDAGGHGFGVSRVTASDAALKTCHLLYVSGVPVGQAVEVTNGLQTTPVLTISDIDNFANRGGIAQFFFENGRMRFAINLGAARRARLQLSSKLLALAVIVDPPTQPVDDGFLNMDGFQR